MYRISASVLEKFRRMQVAAADDSNTWDTEQSVLDTMTGVFTGTDKTKTGSAFHHLIEHSAPERYISTNGTVWHCCEGIAFRPEIANVAYQYVRDHPHMFHEVPTGKAYQTPLGWFYVTMRVDGLEGVQVRDAKTKYSTPTAQEYLDSSQWKLYLDALSVPVFFYDVFEIKSFKELPAPVQYDFGNGEVLPVHFLDEIRIVQHEPISCFAYPGMQQDIYELLCAFAQWISSRNYWHLLKQYEDGNDTKAAETGTATDKAQAINSTEASAG